MAETQIERDAILQTVRQSPLEDQIALVQAVLESLRRDVLIRDDAGKTRDIGGQTIIEPPLVPPNSSGLAGLLSTDQPPPTDEEVERWLEERRMEKYGG